MVREGGERRKRMLGIHNEKGVCGWRAGGVLICLCNSYHVWPVVAGCIIFWRCSCAADAVPSNSHFTDLGRMLRALLRLSLPNTALHVRHFLVSRGLVGGGGGDGWAWLSLLARGGVGGLGARGSSLRRGLSLRGALHSRRRWSLPPQL